MTSEYHGHATKSDGTHVSLSKEEAKALWDECEEADRKRAEAMLSFKEAVDAMFDARLRLKDLGWSEACYCPKDGSDFAVILYGSTGIFPANYRGQWPTGEIDLGDESHHPDGCMWKAIDKLTDDERAVMERCIADHKDWMERQFKMFEAMDRNA